MENETQTSKESIYASLVAEGIKPKLVAAGLALFLVSDICGEFVLPIMQANHATPMVQRILSNKTQLGNLESWFPDTSKLYEYPKVKKRYLELRTEIDNLMSKPEVQREMEEQSRYIKDRKVDYLWPILGMFSGLALGAKGVSGMYKRKDLKMKGGKEK